MPTGGRRNDIGGRETIAADVLDPIYDEKMRGRRFNFGAALADDVRRDPRTSDLREYQQAAAEYSRLETALNRTRTLAVADADEETTELRKNVEQLERRMQLERQMLNRMIEEANAAREPGIPPCVWQFE